MKPRTILLLALILILGVIYIVWEYHSLQLTIASEKNTSYEQGHDQAIVQILNATALCPQGGVPIRLGDTVVHLFLGECYQGAKQ